MRKLTRVLAAVAVVAGSLSIPSTPASADGYITLYRTTSGCETVLDFGVGLRGTGVGTLEVPEGPGELVAAYVEWAGYDDMTPDEVDTAGGRADSTLTINGVEVVGVQPDGDAGYAPNGRPEMWFAWYADIGPTGLGLLADSGATTLDISGYDTAGGQFSNGLSLMAVYSLEPCDVPSLVEVRTGIDYYWEGLGAEGITAPLIYDFAPLDTDRTARFFLNHAGTDSSQTSCRGDAIWLLAGSGDKPDNIVDVSTGAGVGINGGVEAVDDPFGSDSLPCTLEINPAPDVPYEAGHPFPGGASEAPYRVVDFDRHFEPEWTSLGFTVVIPAGASWVMLQMESEADERGESGASLGGGPFVLSPTQRIIRDLDIDVELTKQVSTAADGPFTDEVVGAVGGKVFWELTVQAKSESPEGVVLGSASGVTVTDIAPAGVTITGAAGDGSVNIATGVWTIGDLAAGATATVVLESTLDAPGRFVNVADVATHNETDIDSTPGNGQANEDDDDSAAVSASLVDVELTKTVDGVAGPVDREIGDTITYEVTALAKATTDDGVALSDVTGLTVSDVLPSSVALVSTSGDGSYDAATGVWTIGDLAAGSSASIQMVVTINSNAQLEFVNVAEVASHDQPDIDSTPGNGPQTPPEDDDDSVTVKLPSVEPTEVENTTTTGGPTTTGPNTTGEVGGGELPNTGAETGRLSWIGILVLILGVDMIIMATSLDRLRSRRQ